MSATALATSPNCSQCGKPLTLDEMHYLDAGDGTATCSDCESKWMAEVEAWKRGDRDEFPHR